MRIKRIKWIICFAFILVFAYPFVNAGAGIYSPADLNDKKVKFGVSLGSAAEDAMKAEAPQASIEYYTDNFLGYTAVAQGKLDAYVYDLVQMQRAMDNGQEGVRLLPETMQMTVKIIVGIGRNAKNRFI